jgi:ATP adenylyltransferase/5',5'''-P-1,P-4-tetraphosphate phosphorylase II
MDMRNYLDFLCSIQEAKPNTMIDEAAYCPFCHPQSLDPILAQRDNILLVQNKYPNLANSFQTVVVETDICTEHMGTYTKEHMRKLIDFGIHQWLAMQKDAKYKSVIFYKNHGPLSGGSLRHAHMQIVGFEHIDYTLHLRDSFFEGYKVHESNGCSLVISSHPMVGFVEFNIILETLDDLNTFADYIQHTAKFILTKLSPPCDSFNLFFYEWKGNIICKAIPRHITSPLFLGYGIVQLANRIEEIIEELSLFIQKQV